MKTLFLLLVSATAFAQVTTLLVCRIDRAFSPNTKFSALNCESLSQRQANFMNQCVPAANQEDSKNLFSIRAKTIFEEEAKIVLRGTPFNTEDDRVVSDFLSRVRAVAQSTSDVDLRADLTELARASREEWDMMKINDYLMAESTHLDMGATRATIMYTVAKTIQSQKFLDITKRKYGERTANRFQREELESIYLEYPEFENMREPNPYSILAELYADIPIQDWIISGDPSKRPECLQHSNLNTEDRMFCRVSNVRLNIESRLSARMHEIEVRAKQSAVGRDLRTSTSSFVRTREEEVRSYRANLESLQTNSANWIALMAYRNKKGDRLGEAYAFKRMCEAQVTGGRNPPPPGRKGSGQP